MRKQGLLLSLLFMGFIIIPMALAGGDFLTAGVSLPFKFNFDETMWSVVVLVAGWILKKWIIPYLEKKTNYETSKLIGRIADDVADYLIAVYPDSDPAKSIAKVLDMVSVALGYSPNGEVTEMEKQTAEEAINTFSAKLGVKKETFGRALIAALQRKYNEIIKGVHDGK